MSPPAPKGVTELLVDMRSGNEQAAADLIPLVYSELRRLAGSYMRRERPDHTLQATALVHEAFMKLFGSEPIEWENRAHFFAVAAQQMRRILVDHARAQQAARRGGQRVKLSLDQVNGLSEKRDEDLVDLDDALQRLNAFDPRAAQAVELRFFGGLTEEETAHVIGVSVKTVKRDWQAAKAWLLTQLSNEDNERS